MSELIPAYDQLDHWNFDTRDKMENIVCKVAAVLFRNQNTKHYSRAFVVSRYLITGIEMVLYACSSWTIEQTYTSRKQMLFGRKFVVRSQENNIFILIYMISMNLILET